MSPNMPVVQVLLLQNKESSRELGPALWAALLEVEQFYNQDKVRTSVERYYISPYRPATRLLASAWHHIGRLFPSDDRSRPPLDLLRREQLVDRRLDSSEMRGRYSGTVDQIKLVARVRSLLGAILDGKHLLIVTDEELTPPPKWRYIVWDTVDGDNSVVSIAPADPAYWRQQIPHRLSVIKHRMRTACLCISGELIGFERCDNPQCFLFNDIDSVTALDFMTEVGPEHQDAAPKLAGCGFSPLAADPELVQKIVTHPSAKDIY